MKSSIRISIIALTLLTWSLGINTAAAALVGWYKLDEGFINLSTNLTADALAGSANYGTLSPNPGGSGPDSLDWITNGLASVPTGTTACLLFTPGTATTSPNVTTTLMTQDQTGNGMAGSGAKSFTAWIQAPAAQVDGNPTIVHMGPASPNGARVDFKLSPGGGGDVLRCEVQGGGVNGIKNLADGNWHFVGVVVPANAYVSNIVLYVDGVQETIASSSSGLTVAINTSTNYPVVIGDPTGSGLGGVRGFTGLIDDVRIYNNALAPSDIIGLYLGPGTAPSATALANQSLVLGSTNSSVTFTAGALGTPPLNIQWKFNGGNLPGQTNDILTISPASPVNVGTYTIAVTNAYGSTNASATLSLNTAPINPPRQEVLVGDSASFSVTMPPDSAGYAYQWLFNGTNIAGATTSTLTLSGASAASASSNYQVAVTLGGISATSSPPAVLNVLPPPSSPYARLVLGDQPAGYWRLDETNGATVAADQTGFYPGGYFGYTGVELGQPGALTNDTDTCSEFTGNNYMLVPYNAQLTTSNGLTLEAWVNPSIISGTPSLISCHGNIPHWGYNLYLSAAGNPVFQVYNSVSSSAPVSTSLTASAALAAGSWAHVVATYDGVNQSIYVNGALAGTQPAVYIPATGIGITFGAGTSTGTNAVSPLFGDLDEPAIYSKVLSGRQIENHYFLGAFGSGVPPAITSQPASQPVVLGTTNATVTFNVSVSGSPPFFYQWYSNGVALPSATGFSLSIPNAGSVAGSYSVVVSNSVHSVTSSVATVTVGTAPVSPGDQVQFAGQPASFSVAMPSYQSYTYQWQFEGANVPGATAARLTLPSLAAANAGSYTVRVTLDGITVQSAPATLELLAAPTAPYEQVISNDVAVAWWPLNDPPGSLAVQEPIGKNFGSVYPDVTLGVEGPLLGDTNTAASFTGYNQGQRAGNSRILVAYNPQLNGAVFSVECWALMAGGLGLKASPVTSRELSAGTSANGTGGYCLYAGIDGNWQFWLGNGTPSWTLLEGPPVVLDTWAHLVGTCDGTNAALYVNGALAARTAVSFVPNSLYSLSIGAGGSEAPAGTDYFDGRIGQMAVYATALTPSQVENHFAAAFPAGAAPRLTLQPLTRATLAGSAYQLSAIGYSTPPLTYQWQWNGANIAGATNATLNWSSVNLSNSGAYQLVLTHAANSLTSAPAPLTVLRGEAVSVHFLGFEGVNTIATNGGLAGYVHLANWNEVGYDSDAATVSNLVNNNGVTNSLLVSWSAINNHHWNGPIGVPPGDYALLGGFIDNNGVSSNVTVTISNIPSNYQQAGYSLYVYMGAPSASSGEVTSGTWYGAVSDALATNYYQSIDLALWDGQFVLATNSNSDDPAPADANYVVFTGLNSSSATILEGPDPANASGPASISGFQLVANTVTPVPLSVAQQATNVVLSWPGLWVLQEAPQLSNSPGAWTDISGATSPYSVPIAAQGQMYFRLRSQ